MSIWALIPLAGLSFAAGYYLSGKFLDPLSRLKQNIEKIESKDLGIKFDQDSDDEVGALVQSFNDLSLRLQSAFHSQERFVQDASHELRTPLTIIQTNLDTVLDNPSATKEEMSLAVNQALVGVRHLKKLVNYLLELTTVSSKAFERVNILDILTSQVTSLHSSATAEGISIEVKPLNTKKIMVVGDDILLGRALLNLLENAIKYSQPVNGAMVPITIAVSATKKYVFLSVSNSGATIPLEKIEKLFERFYQVDPSRSKKLGGYGLGLSIVKKIVDEHNGQITVASENKKTTFKLKLPLSK